MNSPEYPTFFVAQIPGAIDSDDYRSACAAICASLDGEVRVNQPAESVECLEPGTPRAALFIAEFAQASDVRSLWHDSRHEAQMANLGTGDGSLFVSVAGLPYAGLPELPDIPTTASVQPPSDRGPRAYMLIQGTGHDQSRMDQYRDVILPMLKDLGAYYTVFDIDGNVEVLAGDWSDQVFAISRWPDHAAGHAFWDSERYQKTAIPIRTGVSDFRVHFCSGESG